MDTLQTRCFKIDFPRKAANMRHLLRQNSVAGPITWMGSLPQDAQDASGLMYRRNRFYDPKSGRFTQEDPIGLAGGVNAYGFADGDPVGYSDPSGLCLEKREASDACRDVVRWLRAQKGHEFQTAASVYERIQRRVLVVAGSDRRLDEDGFNRDGNPDSWTGGYAMDPVLLNGDFSTGDFLISAVHEAYHLSGHEHILQDGATLFAHAEWRAYTQLPRALQRTAWRHYNRFNLWWPNRLKTRMPTVPEPTQ